MSGADQVDFMMTQGEDFGVQVFWVDGYTNAFTVLSPMRMDIKDEVGTTMYSLETDDDDTQDYNKSIIYNSESGLVQLQIASAVTDTFVPGIYFYDLWVTYQDNVVSQSTRVKKLIGGQIYVEGRITSVI